MPGVNVGRRVVAPVCPHCRRQVFLTMGVAVAVGPDGVLAFDGDLALRGLALHLRLCQEADE